MIRKPIVAGRFYPETASVCKKEMENFNTKVHKSSRNGVFAGVVPHAGWIFSGQIAFNVLASMEQSPDMTFILLGAVHSGSINHSAIYSDDAWETPLGKIEIEQSAASEIILKTSGLIDNNSKAHLHEHSIEVQVPFIQYLFPQAKIVPIMVLPDENAVKIGAILGKIISESKKKIIIIGSSDLTHYGWNYGFAPYGIGQTGHDWVVRDNDKRIVNMILKLDSDKIVNEAEKNLNACGSGAIAAVVAAAKKNGIKEGELLEYTTSCDVMPEYGNDSFVGYAGIVF
ncbi:AmmeMemoRadiSam system protein B [Candidatus Poribacteria bacterium]|nr:AmmeMemoRadiSam system protein B [Candidatus Poribacteria bacterium]